MLNWKELNEEIGQSIESLADKKFESLAEVAFEDSYVFDQELIIFTQSISKIGTTDH